ncbi:PREDICTED: neuroendocrine protein 7B2-like [Priapulus caudatus]|uniref:Neuroendocrine protein 7B2 n=1 Tax=Priapulus caudatus TaxID=37621 RepID=A0ABM1F0J0_PRICU|nr:PREDICTED: neuroendocrine protein 7B2-like [Priapulus caudatus]
MDPVRHISAYCNPPNPCPVGYTAADNCLVDVPNTDAFSRDYQMAQQCPCDKEHMFYCHEDASDAIDDNMRLDEGTNPFFLGETLPVISKKAPLN